MDERSYYSENYTLLLDAGDMSGTNPSVEDAGTINARCATAEIHDNYLYDNDLAAGWCRDGRLDGPCFSPPDSNISASDFVNFGQKGELVEFSDEEAESSPCGYSFYLWNKVTRGKNWLPQLGFFLALFLVCAPFVSGGPFPHSVTPIRVAAQAPSAACINRNVASQRCTPRQISL